MTCPTPTAASYLVPASLMSAGVASAAPLSNRQLRQFGPIATLQDSPMLGGTQPTNLTECWWRQAIAAVLPYRHCESGH